MVNDKNKEASAIVSEIQSTKHFLDYIAIVLKWRRFILVNVVIVTVISIIVSLLLPKWYKATVSILPPRESDILGMSGAVSSMRGIAGLAKLGKVGQQSAAYNYMAILNSRSAMESVIHKFNLKSVYKIADSSMEKTIKELEGNINFEEQKDDYYTIEVLDKDPIRSAEMANYFVEVLNSISTQLGTQEARNNREFIERRLNESKDQLRQNEEALRNYQIKSGIMITPEATSTISAISTLYGLKAQKEVGLAIAKRNATVDNSHLQQLKIELAELNKKLETFPQTGLESFRLYRDVSIQQHIVEYLVPLYEQARIDEQKNIPVVLVLDKAVPPEKKATPRRTLIVVIGAAVALVFSLFLIFIRERIASMITSDPKQGARLNDIRLSISTLFRSKH